MARASTALLLAAVVAGAGLAAQRALPPVIRGVSPASPTSSSTRQILTISGTGFQAGLTVTVAFASGGSSTLTGTEIQNVSSTSFRVLATLSGNGRCTLRVTNPNGQVSNTWDLTVQPGVSQNLSSSAVPSLLKGLPAPVVTGLSPGSGAPGITVVIYGRQLNPPGAYVGPRVVFNTRGAISSQAARVTSDNELSVTVPPGDGTVDAHVETAGGNSGVLKFTYRSPVITAISPTSGGRGQAVTITGECFGVKQGLDATAFLKFGESLANPSQWNDRTIVVKAPTDFGTGTNWNIVTDLLGCLALLGSDSEAATFLLKRTVPGCADLIENVVRKYQLTTNPGFLERRVQVIIRTAAGTSNQVPFTYKVPTQDPPGVVPPAPIRAATAAAPAVPVSPVVLNAALQSQTLVDGTIVAKGRLFTKTWTLRNTGSRDWLAGFRLRYLTGTLSLSHADLILPGPVLPGGTYSFSVAMRAPANPGTYQEDWQFQGTDGGTINVGGSPKIWVRIRVQ